MGEQEGWVEPSGLMPNESLIRNNLDSEQWLKAEERTAELIACIQPNQHSEERRNAVANYVQRLIAKCFPCQVFTFGSVPLKTYLPDGDIDVTAFSKDENMKDTWANQVRDMLLREEKDENAEFSVREVQYIQAEAESCMAVMLMAQMKISLGLTYIRSGYELQIFKVKLIKCLVENIVVDISFNQLGGLCTLCFLEEVDYLINQNHLFKRSIILIKAWCYYESRLLGAHHGLISTYALETLVLYIFHLFNNSFAGPLEVLYRFLEFFSKFDWGNFCVSLWGPVPISLLPNVTADPPRKDNGELLFSKLFLDACSSVYAVFPGGQDNQGQPFVSKHFNVIDPLRVNNNLGRSVSKGNFYRVRGAFAFGAKQLARLLDCSKDELYFEVDLFFKNTWDRHGSQNRPDAPMNNLPHPRFSSNPGHTHKPKNLENKSSNKIIKENGCIPSQRLWKYRNDQSGHVDDRHRSYTFDHLGNEVQGKVHLARTSSSPELTDTYKDIPSRGRPNRATESGKIQISAAGLNAIRKNLRPEVLASQNTKSLVNDHSSVSRNHDDADTESTNFVVSEEIASDAGTHEWLQDEQDCVNMMTSSNVPGLSGQVHIPMNLRLPHLPNSFLPENFFAGVLPTNFPLMDHSWDTNLQFPSGLVPSRMVNYFPGIGLTKKHEESTGIGKYASEKLGSEDTQNNFGLVSENLEMILSKDQHSSTSSWIGLSATRDQIRTTKENPTVRPKSSMSKTSSENSWEGSSTNYELTERSTRPQAVTPSNITKHQIPSLDLAQTSGTDSSIPISPAGESETESSGDVSWRFYPTGPPVPFLTMLPFYNYPTENGNSESSCNFAEDRVLANNHFSQNFISSDRPVHLQLLHIFNSMRRAGSGEDSEEHKSDILYSDFVSHWQNLQYGRFCQNPVIHGPLVHPPPIHLHGHFPWDGAGRPLSTNMNLFTQMMSHGRPHLVPVTPLQSVSNRPSGVYKCYMDEMPRHRTGTGTYLPDPKVVRDRQQPGLRRGNYSYDRSDQHCDRRDRESNWNSNSKTRAAVRNHSRSQTDRSNPRMNRLAANESRTERTYRPDSFHSYDSQNGIFRSNSTQCRTANMAYGVNPNEVSNGPNFSVVFPLEGSRSSGSYDEQRLHNSSD